MTKSKVDAGSCGIITSIEAIKDEDLNVTIDVKSGCSIINDMMKNVGTNKFKCYDICLKSVNQSVFFREGAKDLPLHPSCPVIAGIIKTAEVECGLMPPKDVTIIFER